MERELFAFLGERADTVVNAPFNPALFEITDAGCNKGESVAWLADYLGIRKDEVAVYGDGGNDIAMLERFEHAYATANGTPEAKVAAGTVIGSAALHAVPHHILSTIDAERSYTARGPGAAVAASVLRPWRQARCRGASGARRTKASSIVSAPLNAESP